MIMTPSKLRQDIYKILDRVIRTGRPVEISRRGKILKIVPPEQTSKFANLAKHDILKCDPESIVHMDWSDEWNG